MARESAADKRKKVLYAIVTATQISESKEECNFTLGLIEMAFITGVITVSERKEYSEKIRNKMGAAQ